MELRMRTLLFGVALVACACVDMSEPDHRTTTQSSETQNKLAANKLAANKLAANKLAANKLAANSLSSTRLVALDETADILGSPSGREVYSYMISCALADGTTIEKTGVANSDCDQGECEPGSLANDDHCVDGNCVFEGNLGLAEEWRDRKLSNAGQGWVSACLFARSNVHDTAAEISLRGRHPALAVSQTEVELYGQQEGAFYGNLFSRNDGPIDWYACRGRAEAEQLEAGGLALRDCTEEDVPGGEYGPGYTVCGFKYAGNCGDYGAEYGSAYACRTYDGGQGIFGDCHEDARNGRWGGLTKYRQVITVYVSN
jgi:hypothetical protein